MELERPASGLVYVLIGVGWILTAIILAMALGTTVGVCVPSISEEDIDCLAGWLGFSYLVVTLILAAKGRYGLVTFGNCLIMLGWGFIPIANWAIIYYAGKGWWIFGTRQRVYFPQAEGEIPRHEQYYEELATVEEADTEGMPPEAKEMEAEEAEVLREERAEPVAESRLRAGRKRSFLIGCAAIAGLVLCLATVAFVVWLLGETTYANEALGFSLRYPRLWGIEEDYSGDMDFVIFEGDNEGIIVGRTDFEIEALSAGVAEELIDGILVEAGASQVEIGSRSPVMWCGQDAEQAQFKAFFEGTWEYGWLVVVEYGKHGYIILLASDSLDSAESVYEQAYASFQFLY